MSFQWDMLLLEAGFLAMFLGSSKVVVLLFRWLLFRLTFLSGAVKLMSHDPVVAEPRRAQLSLLDAAATDAARLVYGTTAELVPTVFDRGGARLSNCRFRS